MKTINIAEVVIPPKLSKPGVRSVSWAPDFEHPGVVPFDVAQTIKSERRPEIWYVNPIGTVHAAMDSADFLNAVRKKQCEWFRHLSRQFKNGWRKERKNASTKEINYEYDGVIVLKGIILNLELWCGQRLTNPMVNGR